MPAGLRRCRTAFASAGGELGNAVVFLAEWAPPKRRGLFGSFQQCSTIGGTIVGSGVAAWLNTALTSDALESWGWRLPFVFGGVVIAPLAYYLRRHVEETPLFEKSVADASAVSRSGGLSWLALVKLIGMVMVWTVSYFIFLNYLPTFLQKNAGVPGSVALWANTLGLMSMTVAIPFWGYVSDLIGRRRPMLIAAAAFILLPYPVFTLLLSGASPATIVLLQVGVGALVAVFSGIAPALMSEMFPTRLRTMGVSLGHALATTIFGGFAPFIASWLIERTGSPLAPTFYVIVAALVSTVVIATLRETAFDDIS